MSDVLDTDLGQEIAGLSHISAGSNQDLVLWYVYIASSQI